MRNLGQFVEHGQSKLLAWRGLCEDVVHEGCDLRFQHRPCLRDVLDEGRLGQIELGRNGRIRWLTLVKKDQRLAIFFRDSLNRLPNEGLTLQAYGYFAEIDLEGRWRFGVVNNVEPILSNRLPDEIASDSAEHEAEFMGASQLAEAFERSYEGFFCKVAALEEIARAAICNGADQRLIAFDDWPEGLLAARLAGLQ